MLKENPCSLTTDSKAPSYWLCGALFLIADQGAECKGQSVQQVYVSSDYGSNMMLGAELHTFPIPKNSSI